MKKPIIISKAIAILYVFLLGFVSLVAAVSSFNLLSQSNQENQRVGILLEKVKVNQVKSMQNSVILEQNLELLKKN